MDDHKKAKAFGMAWIFGKQKPFYNPRKIRKGKFKGMIEVEYLAKPDVFRKTRIRPADIVTTDSDARGLARQMEFDDLIKK